MRKLLFLMIALLMLVFTVLPVAATPADELADLARFYDSDVQLFAALRIDDAFIDDLNGLVQNVDNKMGGMLGGMSLRDGLDMLAMQIDPEGDFESVFGWAGDTIAMGLVEPLNPMNMDSLPPDAYLIAVAVSDARAAELFLDNLFGAAYEKTDTNAGGILYAPPAAATDMPTFYLAEDVLLIHMSSSDPESLVPDFETSLADTERFQDAIAALPLDDYNAVGYIDPMLYLTIIEDMQMQMNPMMPEGVDYAEMLSLYGGIAEGFTILDGRNLVIDVVTHLDGVDSMLVDSINTDFVSNLPETTALFFQSSNFGPQIVQALASLEETGNLYDEQYAMGALPFDQQDLRNLDEAATFLRQSFEGLTGLSLEEALGSLDGDYISYLNIMPSTLEDIPVLPDTGMIMDTSDSAPSAIIEAMPNLLHDLGIDYTEEDGMIVIPLIGDMVGMNELDILIGENDGLLVSGTRLGVSALGGASMADNEAFQNASQYFLEDTQFLAYINFAPLSDLVTSMAQMGIPDMQEVALIMPLLESASITSHYADSGDGHVRMVLTLAP